MFYRLYYLDSRKKKGWERDGLTEETEAEESSVRADG